MTSKRTLQRCLWIVLISLLVACGTFPQEQTVNPTQTNAPVFTLMGATDTPLGATSAVASPAVAQPTVLPRTMGKYPPACTFPLAQTTTAESTPEKYSFSEPKIVSNSNASIEIIEWLPDSQRVLITRGIHNTPKENIELFNPQTGETQIYAVRMSDMRFRPVWVESLKSVIYPERLSISASADDKGKVIRSSIVERQQLWLSRGDSGNAQILDDIQFSPAIVPHEWVTSSLAVKPDGSQIVYLKSTGEQPYQLYSSVMLQDALEAAKQSVIQWNFGGEGVWLGVSDKMSWRTDTAQIFFYSYASTTSQTLLLDIDSGQACALSFGGWVYMARWSPNGQYLAVIKAQGPKNPMSISYDLVVLDTATGKLYSIDSTKVGPPEMKNCCRHIIGDLAWAPDNRHLAIIGTADYSGTGTHNPIDRLYLVDFLSGDVDNLFPSYDEFTSNYFGSSLAWSPDGSKLLATCPTEKEGRLCFISVHRSGQ